MDFTQISIIFVLAAFLGILARLVKQPVLVGYLAAGMLLSAFGFVTDSISLNTLGQIGVTFLLFLLGLEIRITDIKSVGKVSFITGLFQIFFTTIFGIILSLGLGFNFLESIYIAASLTFSSTIIIIKLLSEKKDLSSLYGKITVGMLLVQDFTAILILMFLSGLTNGTGGVLTYLFLTIKAIILFVVIMLVSKYVLPKVFDKIASDSQELTFTLSIAWALGVASIVAGPVGFSVEIGGFLAGIALSMIPENLQVASKTKPLRDFFLTLFFVYLGAKVFQGANVLAIAPQALVLSAFVLFGNPLIVLVILGYLGYKKRTSFFSGLAMGQVSEFSFILMGVGLALNHIRAEALSTVVLVGVVTMCLSTYMILEAEKLYKFLEKYLNYFERRNTFEKALLGKINLKNHIIIAGGHRTGGILAKYLNKKGIQFVIIDFDPEIYKKMIGFDYPVILGDISDPEIIEAADIEKSKLVISTVPSFEDNMRLLALIKNLKDIKIKSIFVSGTKREAIKLYENGATLVLVPEFLAGDYVKQVLFKFFNSAKVLDKIGENYFEKIISYR